ncbi:hypothetical protein BKA70DRAFT_1225837 [Coprinopsis sp. MPI-PUGE-AT-0042]|nr:hypothetical protein BKA70DRAFT_1225837 [Coprinopsis sp. MPI-PUGE-AT-0042]
MYGLHQTMLAIVRMMPKERAQDVNPPPDDLLNQYNGSQYVDEAALMSQSYTVRSIFKLELDPSDERDRWYRKTISVANLNLKRNVRRGAWAESIVTGGRLKYLESLELAINDVETSFYFQEGSPYLMSPAASREAI